MVVTPDDIDRWRSAPREGEKLEFKEAKNQYDNGRLFDYCCALANEGGGRLLLGISDKPPRMVVGSRAFDNLPGITKKILDAVGFRVDVQAVEHSDGRVVVFTIPSRPLGAAYKHDGRYLMRAGESLEVMSDDRLREVFAEGQPDWLSSPAATDVSAEQVVTLLETQAYFDLLKIPYPATRDAVLDRFAKEHLINRVGSRFNIPNLGAILFAKSLDGFDGLSRKAPRVIVYDGTGKMKTKREQVGVRGYAVSFEGLVQFVLSQLPANEVIEQALRRDMPMFPPLMLRETIANALIHQDFLISGTSVVIEIYDDRVEISNPGAPSVNVDRFIDEYRSRNEKLASLMRRLGVCEEKGSGIDKVVDTAEANELPAPEFRADSIRTTCILYGPRAFSAMGKEDRVRACYQHGCLRYVMNATMTNNSLRKRFGLPDEKAETASRVLRDTVEAGLVKLQDSDSSSKRFAQYLPYWA
jgi:ATP-dependent DNA helicase RecG